MATIELIKDAIKRGEYKDTTLDQQKKNVDFLLQSIDGKYYTIWMNKKIELPKGTEIYSEKTACIVGKRSFEAFAAKHSWATDF